MPVQKSGRKGRPVEIDTAEGIAWLCEKSKGDSESKKMSHRERLYREQADEKALANAERKKDLLPRASVRDALITVGGAVASELDGVPSRVASELAGINNAREVRERLLFELRRIRTRIARSISEYIVDNGGTDPMREIDSAAKENNTGCVGRRKQGAAKDKS